MIAGPWRAMFIAAAACAAAASVSAQERQFRGEIIPQGGNQSIKVLECRPKKSGGNECLTQLWENGRAASNANWWDAEFLTKNEVRAVGEFPLEELGARGHAAAHGPAVRRARAGGVAGIRRGRRCGSGRRVCLWAPLNLRGVRGRRYRVTGHYYCFVSKDGEWTCGGGDGAPKITHLP